MCVYWLKEKISFYIGVGILIYLQCTPTVIEPVDLMAVGHVVSMKGLFV